MLANSAKAFENRYFFRFGPFYPNLLYVALISRPNHPVNPASRSELVKRSEYFKMSNANPSYVEFSISVFFFIFRKSLAGECTYGECTCVVSVKCNVNEITTGYIYKISIKYMATEIFYDIKDRLRKTLSGFYIG